MGHLDKRMDADKDATGEDGGRLKDGTSGNVQESTKYDENKGKDRAGGTAPDVIQKGTAPPSSSDKAL